ncbi:MAG: DUF554 domain-containing protein [Clostridiaceae bacterium]|jgi:uncharacterized membrane protein YqgA involved in biofilm formation|nr:DUF554 domain-containing protein [Clostridiaceae bacterium]
MPVGIIVNVLSVVTGGLIGSVVGNRLSEDLKSTMTLVFGLCSMGMGIASIVVMKNMPAVVLAIIFGTLIGRALKITVSIQKLTGYVLGKLMKNQDQGANDLMLTAVVLFCASGTGICGSLESGMTGDHSLLLVKAVLDLFTAMIFASKLGKATAMISIPQFIIMISLFLLSRLIVPLTTGVMIDDFKACAGLILLGTGFRMVDLKPFPTADMIPALVLVMPISYAWVTWLLPLIG